MIVTVIHMTHPVQINTMKVITGFQVKEYIKHIIYLSSTECNSLDLEDLIGSDLDIFPARSNFSPFATRTEALLFILINSPQPIVKK